MKQDRPLYAQFEEPWTQLRLSWLRGRIAAGTGRLNDAEQLFRSTRDGFLAAGIGYDAERVSRDLARVEGRAAGLGKS